MFAKLSPPMETSTVCFLSAEKVRERFASFSGSVRLVGSTKESTLRATRVENGRGCERSQARGRRAPRVRQNAGSVQTALGRDIWAPCEAEGRRRRAGPTHR